MTEAEAAKIVAVCVAHYPQAQFSREASNAYRKSLMDLDYESAQSALARVTKTSKFLPSVAEIRSAYADVVFGPPRLGTESWGDVVAAIRKFGAYREPKFDDPGVAQVVKSMGWRNLCLGENEAADRAKFVDQYNAQEQRRRDEVVSGHALPPATGYARLTEGKPNGTEPKQLTPGSRGLASIGSLLDFPQPAGAKVPPTNVPGRTQSPNPGGNR